MQPAAARPPTKAQKILRRTLSGARLVAGLALILWLTSRSNDGEPVFYTAAAVLALAVWELSRMGRCRAWPVLAVFVAPLALLAALHFAELRADRRALEHALLPEALGGAWRENLLYDYALAGLVALGMLSLLRAFAPGARTQTDAGARPSALGLGLAVLGYAGIVAAIVAVTRDPFAARSSADVVALAAGVVVLGGLPRLVLSRDARAEALALTGLALWLLPPILGLWGTWRAYASTGLVAVLLLSKIGDTAGYYFGSWLGKTHPFPKISPGKTTAGCVASFCAATVIGGVSVATGLLPDGPYGLLGGLAAGAALNLAAQAGDLLESWIKRRVEVKDSSTWFGPSGGLLDQLDSLLLSIPVAVLLFPVLFPR
ncbi:MAG: phosphatidate cytidylyltransferase [Planctomycetes bacterium]|nr:phosphatidate cytidylyltransferase [Planctomycetota bacterium]